jgi:hypothetical protein
MASKLTATDVPNPQTQSDLISKIMRDGRTNLKNKINEVIDEISALQIGTTNAETTAARPYHTSLKERLDSINDNQANYMKSGGAVTESSPQAMTVEISAGEATVDGVDVKWAASTSGTITAPAISTGGIVTRLDVVVVNSDSTLTVITGAESETPVFENVTQSQKALAYIKLTSDDTVIVDANIIDARDMGAWYCKEGVHKYKWYIQDAIDDLTNGGNIYVGAGTYYEDLTVSGSQYIKYDGGATLYGSDGVEVIDRPSGNVYDTGWINNSDWTSKTFTITHNLNTNLAYLNIRFLISTDGTDNNSFEVATTVTLQDDQFNTDYLGLGLQQSSVNEVTFTTPSEGIYVVNSSNTTTKIDTENWYYKVIAYKFI